VEHLDDVAGGSGWRLIHFGMGADAHDLYHAGQSRLLVRMHGEAS
jgi:hypothetical protein